MTHSTNTVLTDEDIKAATTEGNGITSDLAYAVERIVIEKLGKNDAVPVAWAHDAPDRLDVIHDRIKQVLVQSRDAAGHLHRPLDKSKHYTIALYDATALAAARQQGYEAARAELVLPEGWKLIAVNEAWSPLERALERAQSKGYLPDAIADEWDAFDYRDAARQPTTN